MNPQETRQNQADLGIVISASHNPCEQNGIKVFGRDGFKLDDADDILIKPFAGAVDSSSIWMQRGIPALLAFLLFGVGLRIAAAYVPGGGRR